MSGLMFGYGKNKIKFHTWTAIITVAFLAGCASSEITASRPYMGPQLSKPSQIVVHDFTSNFSEVPVVSPLRTELMGMESASNAEHDELSRKLGAQIANDLVLAIQEMGLPAVHAASAKARPGDIVLKGYFLTLEAGSAAERVALGFGTGKAELKVTMEGYQMTDQGLRFLGSGEGSAGSGKTPGTALSLGVAIATANPVGLAVSAAAKTAGEVSGKETIEGAGKRISKLITERLQLAFERQGWI